MRVRINRSWIPIVLAPVVLLSILTIWGWSVFGSAGVPFRYLRGERVIIQPSVGIVDTSGPDLISRTTFQVLNMTGKPLRLIGTKTSCTCMLTGGVPATVPPWGRHELDLAVRLESPGEPFEQSLILFTDDRRASSVPLLVRGSALR